MRQRIAHHLDHFAIELDIAAFEIDHDLLAEIVGEVAHQAGKGAEQMFEALHPHPRGGIAHTAEDGGEPFERPVERGLIAAFAQPPCKVVADEDQVRHALHDLVEKVDRKPDRALDGLRGLRGGSAFGGVSSSFARGSFAGEGLSFLLRFAFFECRDQRIIAAFGKLAARFDRIGHLADPVDDGEHGGYERAVGLATARAHFCEGIFGRMAQPLEARKIEEAAIALHRMDEAEDGIETRAVGRVGLPSDDFAAARFQHFAGFGDEVRQKIVHCAASPSW